MKKIEIKNILVPVDFSEISEIAMNEAVALSKSLKAKVFLIHVVEFNGYYSSIAPEIETNLPTLSDVKSAVEKKMENIQQEIEKCFDQKPEAYITTGFVHTEIMDYSKKNNIDLIIMGTHGASGYKEFFIGSNAQRVVTLSEIPVMTIQIKTDKSGFKNILIPIDNSLHSREKVNIALIIAALSNAKIHLIGLSASNQEQELKEIKIKLKSVEQVIHAYNLLNETADVTGENLSDAAMKYAAEKKCDLIVINTGHESKSTGIFLGAFAQQIVNHSKIPVLSCKHSEGYSYIDTPGFGI
jgi:nucleotide-binding universal stress UspA family protein